MSIISNGRIIFMGMRGAFSLIPLRALLAAGAQIGAVIIPAAPDNLSGLRRLARSEPPPSDLPLLLSPVSHDIVYLAWTKDIPVFEVSRLDEAGAVSELRALRPALICVACFPRLLPPAWLECPPLGCLNLHPSLLPAYRGPAPLFWQFRAGERRTGVTLHFMDEGADSGDIVAQADVPFADGITGPEADRLAAEAGARLLLDMLQLPVLPRRPQPAEEASYQPYPRPADRAIPVTWPAGRAFNFIRGANEWGPLEIVTSGERFRVWEAVGYDPAGRLESAYRREGVELWLQFSPGILRVF